MPWCDVPGVYSTREVSRVTVVASIRYLWRSLLADIKEFFGPCEFSIGNRRGHIGARHRCAQCFDFHDDGEACPDSRTAPCLKCDEDVPLDFFGNCLKARELGEDWRGHHVVRDRAGSAQ
jgi:hypothetical protein